MFKHGIVALQVDIVGKKLIHLSSNKLDWKFIDSQLFAFTQANQLLANELKKNSSNAIDSEWHKSHVRLITFSLDEHETHFYLLIS